MSEEALYLARAVELARSGVGRVEPNPPVGAVLVQGGEVVGEGAHRLFGGPHAEVEALRRAGERARGATLYVSLEPCCHHGKTPPCTEAILAAGVSEVVYGVVDPFSRVQGRGHARLAESGVSIRVARDPLLSQDLLMPYFRWTLEGLPWVLAKWASSLDGRIATRTGESKWITSPLARERVQTLRDRHLAVLVGSGTAIQDDPLLTCRIEGGRQPLRVVVDSRCALSVDSRLVRTANEAPLLVATTPEAPGDRVESLERAGAEVLRLPPSFDGRVDLGALLAELARRGRVTVLVEGGAGVLGSLFDRGLVNELEIHLAPIVLGGSQAPAAVGGVGVGRIAHAFRLERASWEGLGDDLVIRGRVRRPDHEQALRCD